jgi:tRNA dimethylallyltransferase
MDLKSKIILISGPTASGKSSFAIKLAKKIKGEIVNADSMQVYKQLKILSARPDPKNYQSIKHHLYGFQDAKKNFSTGDWLKIANKKITEVKKRKKIPIFVGGTGLYFKALTDGLVRIANKKITEVKKRKKIPIFVGGTGLYFKALTDGLVRIPNIPIKFRNQIRNLNKKIGQNKFYKQLLKIDPLSKNKINPTDTQRSIRAFEVKKFTKKSLHDWFKNTKSNYLEEDFFKIYIDYPRDELIERIHQRTAKMIKIGAVNEVKRFLKIKIKKQMTAFKAIGVNEIQEYLSKEKKIDEIKEKISIKTRQYAKRQSTWARGHMSDWVKLKPSEINKFLKKI